MIRGNNKRRLLTCIGAEWYLLHSFSTSSEHRILLFFIPCSEYLRFLLSSAYFYPSTEGNLSKCYASTVPTVPRRRKCFVVMLTWKRFTCLDTSLDLETRRPGTLISDLPCVRRCFRTPPIKRVHWLRGIKGGLAEKALLFDWLVSLSITEAQRKQSVCYICLNEIMKSIY